MPFLWPSVEYTELTRAKPSDWSKDLLHVQNCRTKPMSETGNMQPPSWLSTVSTFVWKDFPTIFFQKCVNQSGLGRVGRYGNRDHCYCTSEEKVRGQRLRNLGPDWLLCHLTPAAQGILVTPLSRRGKNSCGKKFVKERYAAQLTCFLTCCLEKNNFSSETWQMPTDF